MSPALVYLFISNLITLLSNSFTPLLGPGYAEGRLVYNVNLGVRVNSVLHANDGAQSSSCHHAFFMVRGQWIATNRLLIIQASNEPPNP